MYLKVSKPAANLTQFAIVANTSGGEKISSLTPKEFADRLGQRFDEVNGNNLLTNLWNRGDETNDYAKKSAVQDIYLIGGTLGFIRTDGTSLAQNIADQLHDNGFINVRVHALTNIPDSTIVRTDTLITTSIKTHNKHLGTLIGHVSAYAYTKDQPTLAERTVQQPTNRITRDAQCFVDTNQIKNELDRPHNTFTPKQSHPPKKNLIQEKIIIALEKMVYAKYKKQNQEKQQLQSLIDSLRSQVVTPRTAANDLSSFITSTIKNVSRSLKKSINEIVEQKIPSASTSHKRRNLSSQYNTFARDIRKKYGREWSQRDQNFRDMLGTTTKQLDAIDDYAETIKQNQQGTAHIYNSCCLFSFSLSVEEKAGQLTNLINDIYNSKDIDDVKYKLQCLLYDVNEDKNDYNYDTLNTGQNLTTRIFGTFGLLDTSTMRLIKAFASAVDDKIAEDRGYANCGCC